MDILLGTGALVVLASLVAAALRLFPAFDKAVFSDDLGRMAQMDGLRGILGILVALHHTVLAHRAFDNFGLTHFENWLGQGAVALFFMVSAYLFLSRLENGGGRLDWRQLYRGRVLRLVPMYLFAVSLLFLIVAHETRYELRVASGDLAVQVVRWLSFTFLLRPPINGYADTVTILSVTWTLRFEWLFYFALPILGLLLIRFGRLWPAYLVILLLAISGHSWLVMGAFFAGGGLAVGLLRHAETSERRLAWALCGAICLILLIRYFHAAFGWAQAVLLVPVFVAAMSAAGPWSVLRWRPLRFLGHISYSTYLLHTPIIHVLVTHGIGVERFRALAVAELYAVGLVVMILTAVLATLTYLLIERPFMRMTARPVTAATGEAA
jgi:peptidoglycan/LPS O-acetylase OafA/YrhL